MKSNKIIYGIDLGTTNSAIARFENGKAVVKKSGVQGDTTPSCVAYTKSGKTLVGVKAHSQLEKDYQLSCVREGYEPNSFIEFKRKMGTDEIMHSNNLGRDVTPEELSSEVLKELRKYVLDDDVRTAVITVPAMFDNNQKDATKRAAKLAGFEHVELIQEPVAASVAYGLDSKMKDAYWVVFDFGGGTFDAALMKIEDGIMKPVDTAGNNKLGGKDIDKAIFESFFLPYFKENYNIDEILSKKAEAFMNMWKPKAEEIKIQLSFNESYTVETDLGENYGQDDEGTDFEMCLTITQEMLEPVVAPIYQKAIDLTKQLLERNNLDGERIGALILVGGPTHSPIVRKMLREQVTSKVDTSIDPMTCVACGAALYGSTVDVPDDIVDKNRDRSKIQLKVDFKSTSVQEEEWGNVFLLTEKCDNYDKSSVLVDFVRTDGLFSLGKQEVTSLGAVITLKLKADSTNLFEIRCYDEQGTALECEPNSLSIIQGIDGIGDAVMPMSLGLGTADDEGNEVFDFIEGLAKGVRLPASGVISGLHTQKAMRPGILEDEIRMSLYQLDEPFEKGKKGPRAFFTKHLYDIILTGEDIPNLLPEDSEVNIRMHAERSGTIDSFIVDIPYLDTEIDLTERVSSKTKTELPKGLVMEEFRAMERKANQLNDPILKQEIADIKNKYIEAGSDRDTKDQVLADMQALGIKVDTQYSLGDWEREEQRLRGMFDELEKDNQKYGNAQTTQMIEQLRHNVDEVIRSKNVEMARELYDQLWAFDYKIAEVEFFVVWILDWQRQFNQKTWKDRNRARSLINQGLEIIQNQPTTEKLRPIVDGLISLLPDDEKPGNDDILRKREK
jgi:molecular chaperone DnaK